MSEQAQLLEQISEELQTTINEQQAIIDRSREEAKILPSPSERDSRPARHDLAEKREEIAGLKYELFQLERMLLY